MSEDKMKLPVKEEDEAHPTQMTKRDRKEPKEISDNVILEEVREDINDIRITVEANISRVNHGNPVVNHMLKMIASMLGTIVEYMDFTEVDKEIEGMHKERNKSEEQFSLKGEDL